MVPFKPYFTGAVELPFTRAASVQKCLRTTDLENVGKTERHCTFFEMLGNFSFGDYFKEGAIDMALEFSTKYLEIPMDRIWITVFETDDEAETIWKSKGVAENRIVRLGKKDNFWGPAGESGACGPCSELYLDRGPEKGGPNCGNNPQCKPGCDCDRYLEFWNLVFNQYNQTVEGKLEPLKQTGIDTGAGLERIAALLQEKESVYDTDEFAKILNEVGRLSTKNYEESTKQAFRVIADHIRSISFAVGDRIYPDRTGRGYVIRRLIRRAAVFGRRIGLSDPFLYKLVDTVVEIYSKRYPELLDRKADIKKILENEELLFQKTLDLGLDYLQKHIDEMVSGNAKILSGEKVFFLYSTYGFPLEMTREILGDMGLSIDEKGFQKELEKDRNQSRESWKGKKESILAGLGEQIHCEFEGYNHLTFQGSVVAIFKEGKKGSSIQTGEEGIIILDKTPFYGESGGQVGDHGFLKHDNVLFEVFDTQKDSGVVLHFGKVIHGNIKEGMPLHAEVNAERRSNLKKHHSGTHLMNGALRRVLGEHVFQKASLVQDDFLRFDFSHPSPLSEIELFHIEQDVNQAIKENHDVVTKELPIEEAKKTGAVAFFDEKYGSRVRVVQMGDRSIEFCGGTHVSKTSEIQYFTIIKESSPGAGNRRIEAVCGKSVVDFYRETIDQLIEKIQETSLRAKELGVSNQLNKLPIWTLDDILSKLESPEKGVKELRDWVTSAKNELDAVSSSIFKEQKKQQSASFQNNTDLIHSLWESKKSTNGISVVISSFEGQDAKSLKEISDTLRNHPEPVLVALSSISDHKTILVVSANPFAIDKGVDSGKILSSICQAKGGKGGGKKEMAQGGLSGEISSSEFESIVLSKL
jgi:alanyl-tRNA synthetase